MTWDNTKSCWVKTKFIDGNEEFRIPPASQSLKNSKDDHWKDKSWDPTTKMWVKSKKGAVSNNDIAHLITTTTEPSGSSTAEAQWKNKGWDSINKMWVSTKKKNS
mmetsp:Transcript_14051/g.23022  ORF Transcript_14051/g.23022 Transcript_14051/m.23022 type:complete len:105 (-) Transcript_14051:331-645(-)